MKAAVVAAVDLGATSGRVILGRMDDAGLHTRHISRFGNGPVRLPDGLHWNILELYRQVLAGLAAAERTAPGEIASVAIDTWGVDYGLVHDGSLLGPPFHYRDARGDSGVAAVHARIDASALFARNGLQHLPMNTLFQLATDGQRLTVADHMLLTPDLLAFWLTGTQHAERTIASTTGLLDARTRQWDVDLADTLGVPRSILPPLVDPGTVTGELTPHVVDSVGATLKVVAVGSHDTASAVVAIPSVHRDFAYVSCGTWGLVGLEVDAPVLTEDARTAGFTNECGVDGRTRFQSNVMGLWLLSESMRQWAPAATDAQRSSHLQQLLADAARVESPMPTINVNDPRFLPPGDIPGRIASWCREHSENPPGTPAEFVRCIVESLAVAFAACVDEAERIAGRDVSTIHIVGGGSQNALLCQAVADRSDRRVVAGPVEATAIGNILIQARTNGFVDGGLTELRSIVRRSFTPTTYVPRHSRSRHGRRSTPVAPAQ
ncbi:rhamnulokinase [Cellulomonas sp. McL0617]|uniref:rhamnulokinase n=1 Tax=Cellulomonas sp. McL0617 TaxID=3415675 RepID=UPI003CF79EC4